MRVPDLIFYLFFQKENEKVRNNIEKKYMEIITGKRVGKPSDDPVSFEKIQELKKEISSLSQFGRNRLFADTVLTYADTLLSGIEDRLKALYSSLIRASNGTLNEGELKAIGREFEEALKVLVKVANEKVGKNYIFSGASLNTKPFDENTFDYLGSNKDFEVLVDEGYRVKAFLRGDYVFGVNTTNIFKVIKSIADKLSGGTAPDQTDIDNLKQAYDQIVKIRSEIGSVLKELRNIQTNQEDKMDTLNKIKSDNEDADLAKSISDYRRYELTYEAIMKLFANRRLTILEYI